MRSESSSPVTTEYDSHNIPPQEAPQWEDQLTGSLADANIPILLMVLYQLTGDESWLRAPFSPTRARGLDTNPTGGLPTEIASKIRDGARNAIVNWHRGRVPEFPSVQGERLTSMLSVAAGEDVPLEYAGLLAQEMGFSEPELGRLDTTTAPSRFAAIVVGAGISGMAASMALTRSGVEHTILERNESVGGTWSVNRYPGCGVDTPSHLYAFSQFPSSWSTHFARQPQVQEYLDRIASEQAIREKIEFGRNVVAAEWDDEHTEWVVTDVGKDGDSRTRRANILITAVGLLSEPHVPSIPGLDRFRGAIFHSAEWPEGFDLAGKRVAVIGSGASAMQIVPSIIDQVDQLVVLQRSPQWIAPSESMAKPIDHAELWLFENVPFYRSWFRAMLWWTFGDRIHDSLRIDPSWAHPDRSVNATNDSHRSYFTRYLQQKLAGRPDLIEKSLPTYPPFGKRMLLDNGWFDALLRENCTLVESALSGLTEHAVVTADGHAIEVDVVVLATGFKAKDLLSSVRIVGRDGGLLGDLWGDENPTAYLGMTVPKFPNMFIMYGPNTNLGHGGSYIFLAECEVHYIADLITQMDAGGIASVECLQNVHDEYNRGVDAAHESLLWKHPSAHSWYLNSHGRVVTNSPWRMVEYWQLTRKADLDDYDVLARSAMPLTAT